MKLRQLWKLLSGVALLVSGLLIGASAPATASTGGCAGDVVVALDVAVWSRPGQDTYDFTLTTPLSPGVWTIQTVSSDTYEGRSDSIQGHEQWELVVVGDSSSQSGTTTFGPTSDLADSIESTSVTDNLGTIHTITGVQRVTVRHAAPSTPEGTNSVTADCVGFTLIEQVGDGLTATSNVDCSAGTVSVDVSNEGALPAHFDATLGDESSNGTLVPGASAVIETEISGGVTRSAVMVEGATVLDESLDTSCAPEPPVPPVPPIPPAPTTPPVPSTPPTSPPTLPPASPPPAPLPAIIRAAVVVDCAADEVLVLLGNDGDIGTTVDVALPLSDVQSGVVVDGGSVTTSTLAIGGLDDGTTEVRISDSTTGLTYVREAVDLNCNDPARPTAATVLDCVSRVVVIHLGNEAGDSIALTVLHERVQLVATLELAAGEVAEVEIPLGDDESVPVRVVDADGNDVLRVEVDNICPELPDPDGGLDGVDDNSGSTPGLQGPVVVAAECGSVDLDARTSSPVSDEFDVTVEIDGTVLVDGTVMGDATIPVVPGVPTRIIVSERGSDAPVQVITPSEGGCAEVRVIVEPDCASSNAEVSIRREGVGRERFVVLVNGEIAGVLAIEGTGTRTVPVALGSGSAELHVSRSMAAAPVVVGTLTCDHGSGVAGVVAASMVVLAVLGTAAGALPWSPLLRPT